MSDHDRVASLEARVASLEQAVADVIERSGELTELVHGFMRVTALEREEDHGPGRTSRGSAEGGPGSDPGPQEARD